MEDLDTEGLFWLATNPEYQVAGRLKFDSINGAELNLIGSLDVMTSSGNTSPWGKKDYDKRYRIHGVADLKHFTLDRCLLTQESFQMPGTAKERYRVPIVLIGRQFAPSDQLEFSSVSVRMSHLEHWVHESGVEVGCLIEEETKTIKQVQITYTPPESQRICTFNGELELSFFSKTCGDHVVRSTIEQGCEFRIQFPEPLSLERAMAPCNALQDLVTMGMDAPSTITEVSLGLPESVSASASDDDNPRQVRLLAELRGSNIQVRKDPPHRQEMAFTFESIGGIDGVGKWMEVADRLRAVIGSLMNIWYAPGLVMENRFVNVIISAEALIRLRVNKQRFSLERELNILANDAGDTFQDLVEDTKSWANTIVKARNNYVFHRGLRGSIEGPKLYLLSESLYFLVVISLLRECGLSHKTLANIGKHQRFRLLARQLRGEK